jgi:hypothetical protein
MTTQPFDELESRGPWRLNRQTALPVVAAIGAAVVAYLYVVHGALATVMLTSALMALASTVRWITESLPSERREQVEQLIATIDEHLRPWAHGQAERAWRQTESARLRVRSSLRPLHDAVDAAVERHVPTEHQHRVAQVAMVAASVMTALAVVAAATPQARSSQLAVSRGSTPAVAAAPAVAAVAPPLPHDAKGATTPAVAAPAHPAAATAAKAAASNVPKERGPLPVGKGMWIWLPERAEGGNAKAIVDRATSAGLSHIYVKVGSSVDGLVNVDFLKQLLPAAHAAHIRVYGWDFPYLDNWQDDVNRAIAAANITAPGGHRLDGFTADIELQSMGVNISPASALAYGGQLRRALGPKYPLIATVPRPSPALTSYPFAELAVNFDALAPMVYWLNREAGNDVAGALFALARYGRPVLPIGQAYDGAAEGGRPGVPSPEEIKRFMQVAEQFGAPAVSFWSWQHANDPAWAAIHAAPQFTLPAAPNPMYPGQIHAYQSLLNSLGFPVKPTNQLDQQTASAVAAYQLRAHLPVTGVIDAATRAMLLTPFAPPIQPQG